jgi:hypothetical protein
MSDKAALQHHQTEPRSEVSAFELVRMEYEQLRQDERQHTAVSVALVAVIITVLAAMTTVFVVVDRSKVSVPSWLYLINADYSMRPICDHRVLLRDAGSPW